MQYFVLTPSGQKFGPADLYTLAAWVKEGRVLPNTILEESTTGQQVMANQVAGLGFPAPGNFYQGVQPSPPSYPRIVDSPGDKLANTAKALGITGFFLCPIFSLIGIGVALMAMKHGSAKAKGAMIICLGGLAIQVLLMVLFYRGVFSYFESSAGAGGID